LDLRGRKWQEAGEEELRNLYASPNVISVIKPRRMGWDKHVARTREFHTTFLSGNLKGRDHSEDIGVYGKIVLEWK
jgi:hypothetical protein